MPAWRGLFSLALRPLWVTGRLQIRVPVGWGALGGCPLALARYGADLRWPGGRARG